MFWSLCKKSRENAKEELEKLKAAIEEKREAFRQNTESFQPRAFKVFKRNKRQFCSGRMSMQMLNLVFQFEFTGLVGWVLYYA